MAEKITQPKNTTKKKAMLILNIILLTVGNCADPLISRLYFVHGGKKVWFSSSLQTAGWPVIIIPITTAYLHRRHTGSSSSSSSSLPPTKFFELKPLVLLAAAIIGVLTGLADYLYADGVSRLPVSTSSLINTSELAVTAAFAFFFLKQEFTFYSLNAVFLLTLGPLVLALHTNGDRPDHESESEYVLGFLMAIGASVLYGIIWPLIELIYKKAKQEISYAFVLEIQMVMCFFSSVFCILGMVVNKEFPVCLSLL